LKKYKSEDCFFFAEKPFKIDVVVIFVIVAVDLFCYVHRCKEYDNNFIDKMQP
jgi:hypothetical protein